MVPDVCVGCGKGQIIEDVSSKLRCCDCCGRVYNDRVMEFESEGQELGFVLATGGNVIAQDDTGARGVAKSGTSWTARGFLQWSDQKKFEAENKVKRLVSVLIFPKSRVDEVLYLMQQSTDGELGTGRWIDILAGACMYVVVRQNSLALSLIEIANAVDCDPYHLGRMYHNVLNVLQIEVPGIDPVIFFERAVSSIPAFATENKEITQKVMKQGRILLENSSKWFITTGRHFLPVVAAVLLLVCEVNNLKVDAEDVTRHLPVVHSTMKSRYLELQLALVGYASGLPWGKDITLKSLPRHLPFLFQFLEVKYNLDKRTLNSDGVTAGKNTSIAQGTAKRQRLARIEAPAPSNRDQHMGPGPADWSIVHKFSVGEVLPKSFVNSEDARSRRRLKIDSAKARLHKVQNLGNCEVLERTKRKVLPCQPFGKERDLDMEDILIERLLLHGADETQIEDGYYRALLDLKCASDEQEASDEDLMEHLRTKAEVAVFSSLMSFNSP